MRPRYKDFNFILHLITYVSDTRDILVSSGVVLFSDPPPSVARSRREVHMHTWYRYTLLAVLALLLSACGVATSSAAVSAPTAIQPTASQPATSGVSRGERSKATPNTNVMPNTPPKTCPVTRPPAQSFRPPARYPRYAPSPDSFWYGTASLWTAVPKTGVWSGLPDNPEGYTQKVFWWREGYVWTEEPEPQLAVTGRRLDATAVPLNVSRATNAFAEDIQSAILVGVDFPTLGCWEITGEYAGTKLSFVVWVAP